MMCVIQRKTNKFLGTCSIPQNAGGRGRRIWRVTEGAGITSTHFRFCSLYNAVTRELEIGIIAYGYRDASMLPDFEPN